MCVTAAKSKLNNPITFSANVFHRTLGLRRVMGYTLENVENKTEGPNLMLLFADSKNPLGADNIIQTGKVSYLKHLTTECIPDKRTRSVSKSASAEPKVNVSLKMGDFDIDIINDTSTAVEYLKEMNRPVFNEELWAYADKWYPNYPAILCWFENDMQPHDIWIQFPPMEEDVYHINIMESHDGEVPKPLSKRIEYFSTILVGVEEVREDYKEKKGEVEHYPEGHYFEGLRKIETHTFYPIDRTKIPETLIEWMPKYIAGIPLTGLNKPLSDFIWDRKEEIGVKFNMHSIITGRLTL